MLKRSLLKRSLPKRSWFKSSLLKKSLIMIILFSFILIYVASCKSMIKHMNQRRELDLKIINEAEKKREYYIHRDIKTTYFYIGQNEPLGSGVLDNRSSAWTRNWVKAYGDIDNPTKRNAAKPNMLYK